MQRGRNSALLFHAEIDELKACIRIVGRIHMFFLFSSTNLTKENLWLGMEALLTEHLYHYIQRILFFHVSLKNMSFSPNIFF